MLKEILRFRPSTVGRIIRTAEARRASRHYYRPHSRLYVQLSSPYQVLSWYGRPIFINLHTGKIYEHE